ncbi:hypothetical protein [Flavobacterium sp.]|uniref:hypothetical protein n=1 Tax=Flavobacterium sp. TaxID=239 RepID=UPI003341EBF4
MLRVFFLSCILLGFSSYTEPKAGMIPDGTYNVQLDAAYAETGPAHFRLHLKGDTVTMELADQTHTYPLKWIDADSFIIMGYTQPAEPTALEQEMLRGYTPSFNITSTSQGTFRFIFGDQHQADCIYSGSLVPFP